MTIAKPSAPLLSSAQVDRAAGVLLGLACGDALGAGYEFQPARIHGERVDMVGGGGFGWAPGEWTDDTSMAVAIAETSSTGVDLRSFAALDAITVRFVNWARDAPDVGIQTGAVLRSIAGDPTSDAAAASAREHFVRTGRTGNGSLMRTARSPLRTCTTLVHAGRLPAPSAGSPTVTMRLARRAPCGAMPSPMQCCTEISRA